MSKSNKEDKLYSFILSILSKPALFNIERIEDIFLVLIGYNQGLIDSQNILIGKDKEFWEGFNSFVNTKMAPHEKIKSNWPRLIRFYSSNNQHSIELFEKLFKEFMNT